jgi:hypothetical protein
MSWRLYSPLNFAVGLAVHWQARTAMTAREAVDEAHASHPGWPYRAGAQLGVGILALAAVTAMVTLVAEPSMGALARGVSANHVAAACGVLAALGLAGALYVCLRKAAGFYARMCRLGAAAREQASL